MAKKNMMKLEALTEMLDKIDMTPFPISDMQEITRHLRMLYTMLKISQQDLCV